MYDTSSDSKILLDTVQKFMADEIYPHEDRVDKLGYVPDEIGKQIEEKSKENVRISSVPVFEREARDKFS